MQTHSLQALFKMLCELTGVTVTKVASNTGVQRTNIYTWLKGERDQILSQQRIERIFEECGVVRGRLSNKVIYRWRVGDDLTSLQQVLRSFVQPEALEKTQVHFVDTDVDESFNLIYIPEDEITILLSWASLKMGHYPLNASRLGFGKDHGHIQINWKKWTEWWDKPGMLSGEEFWSTARAYLNDVGALELPEVTPYDLIELQRRHQTEITNLTATNAGLCGIIRALLGELRRIDPENRFLDRNNRDWEFNQYYENELKKLEQS